VNARRQGEQGRVYEEGRRLSAPPPWCPGQAPAPGLAAVAPDSAGEEEAGREAVWRRHERAGPPLPPSLAGPRHALRLLVRLMLLVLVLLRVVVVMVVVVVVQRRAHVARRGSRIGVGHGRGSGGRRLRGCFCEVRPPEGIMARERNAPRAAGCCCCCRC
jgi:hypothetical protein